MRTTSIVLEFSAPIKLIDQLNFIPVEPIDIVTDLYGQDFSYSYSHDEGGSQVILNFEDNLASYDVVNVILHSDFIRSYYDESYQLDANEDNLINDEDLMLALSFSTQLLGDYDGDSDIDNLDIDSFVSGWRSNDTEYEIGPFSGVVPNLFTEGKGVVAEGYLKDKNFFLATKILAKHDENYMPPEVKEALEEK